MLFKAFSGAVFGIDAYLVEVEVDVSAGLGNFMTVGLPDAGLRTIKGALSIAGMARQKGIHKLVVPVENAAEAAVVEQVEVYGLKSLPEVLDFVNDTREFKPTRVNLQEMLEALSQYAVDF